MTTQEFIFDLPLYTQVEISETTILRDLCSYTHIDGYNFFRDKESTFYLEYPIDSSYLSGERIEEIRFKCQRYGDYITVLVYINKKNNTIKKVGQYPSVADIHIAQVKKYRKVLGETYIRDFTRAIGLAANGVGTGSFVYLRRIFEHLIDEFSKKAIAEGTINSNEFITSKMDKKLKMIEDYLPEVMKDNKPLYGVLSKGIHELSEEECLAYFSAVRQVIELILDEQEYKRLIEEKKRKTKNELGRIAGEIKQSTRQ